MTSNRIAGGKRKGAFGFDKGARPVAVIQAIDPYTAAAAAAGVNKLVITHVDTGVADAVTSGRAEEQQITRLQLIARHQRCVDIDHVAGGAWQFHAQFFLEQVTDKAAAIETFFGRVFTVTIGDTLQAQRIGDDG